MRDIAHWLTDEVVCPHCGHEHSDSWEMNDGREGDWSDECHACSRDCGVTPPPRLRVIRGGK